MSIPSLYPARCIFCGKLMDEEKLICADCIKEKILVVGKVCGLCGVEKALCSCGARKHQYERKIACVYYKGDVRRGIARLKFYRHTMLAKHYGTLLAQNVKSKYSKIAFDAVIPVPMNRIKELSRGYNCTELLSREVERINNIPIINDVLFRRLRGAPQKRVSLERRAANVLDKFYVKNHEKILGKTLLLIDDVCTTGATLNECAKMLKIYGAKKVYAASFAVVVKGK